jgi:phospholipid/cholesterol/gamma-HCH transport system ATP-binding protein
MESTLLARPWASRLGGDPPRVAAGRIRCARVRCRAWATRTFPYDADFITWAAGPPIARHMAPQINVSAVSAAPLVELRNVSCGYGERVILEGVNLSIPRGKVVALIGTSGGGKTTVLRLLGRQIQPFEGQVLFDGQDLAGLDLQQMYSVRRRMGMLFQFGALFTDLSVFENVAFPLREHTKLPESMIRDLVLMKLNAVGLRGARDLMPSEISGGMARRVALARAIALDPDLVLYDEPFAGLDPISLGIAARLIRDLNDALGLTSVVVSHDLHETFGIADEVVMIANGGVVAQGTPDELRRSEDPLVQQFVGAKPDGPVHFHQRAVPVGEDFGITSAVKERA